MYIHNGAAMSVHMHPLMFMYASLRTPNIRGGLHLPSSKNHTALYARYIRMLPMGDVPEYLTSLLALRPSERTHRAHA